MMKDGELTNKEYIFKLMHRAFLDIRIASYSQDSPTSFILSDVCHNVPLQMNEADKGKISYEDIIVWIQKKCEEKKCISWFNNVTTDIKK
jgi:hypothetical protein